MLCLQTISIRGKPMRRFHSDAFPGLYVCRTLQLSNCNINVMPPLDQTKYTPELLNLQANDLEYIEANYFVGFRRLEMLHLSFDRLSAIINITLLTGIVLRLDVAHNSVLTLKHFLSNACFTELRYLFVSYNKVRELTAMMISQSSRLQLLHIENNLLETLRDLSAITREFFLIA